MGMFQAVRSSDSTSSDSSTEEKNGWYCWLVLAASFITLSVLDGINYSFGILLLPLMQEMDKGRAEIAMAGSLLTGTYAMSGILSAKLTDRYGTRLVAGTGNLFAASGLFLASYSSGLPTLYLTYSLITGFGFGLMYIPAIVSVASHFKTKQGLALGICVCGAGVGTFVVSPLEATLLSQLGWRGTLRVLSAIAASCLFLSALMVPVPADHTSHTDGGRGQSEPANQRSVIRRLGCWVLGEELAYHKNVGTYIIVAICDGIGTLGLLDMFTYLSDYAQSVGVEPEKAAFLISALGISSSVGRVASGWMNDQRWSNPIVLTGCCLFMASFQPIIVTMFSDYVPILVFSCIYGFMTGVWISTLTPLLIYIISLPLLTPAFGLMTAIQGFASLFGTPMAGAVVDAFQSCKIAMYFSSGFLFLASTGFILSYMNNKRVQAQSSYNQLL